MKKTTYRCDNDDCQKETTNIEYDKWLEIGSSDKTLFVNNHFTDRKLISMANHPDLHFCSADCLSKRFSYKKEEVLFTENQIRQLQSKIHAITGDGEVMMLFNDLLGVTAG